MAPLNIIKYAVSGALILGWIFDQSAYASVSWVDVNSILAKGTHPRIYLSDTKTTQLKQKATTKDAEYTKWKSYLDYSTSNGSVHDLSLAYRITGTASYAARAVAKMDNLIATAPVPRANCADYPWDYIDYQVSYAPYYVDSIASGYDWLYDYLTADSTRLGNYKNFLTSRGDCLVSYYGNGSFSAYSNGFYQALYALGEIGMALYGHDPKADTYLDTARNMYLNQVLPASLNVPGGAFFGGGVAEGTGYSMAIDHYRLIQYALSMSVASGVDLIGAGGSFFEDLFRYTLYAVHPIKKYGGQLFSSGDFAVRGRSATDAAGKFLYYKRNTRSFDIWLPLSLLMLIEMYPSSDLAKVAQTMVNDDQYATTMRYESEYIVNVLWANPAQAKLPLDKAGNFYLAKGEGTAFIRGGWNVGDTWIAFNAGDRFAYHQHVDIGNFQINKIGQLAVKSGNYYSSPREIEMLNYSIRTVASNAMLIYNPDEVMERIRANDLYNNDGGQRGIPNPAPIETANAVSWQSYAASYDMANIVASDNSTKYAYVKADLTNAYSSAKVGTYNRSLVYLRPSLSTDPDYIVVLDRVRSKNANFQKKWLLHFLNEPTLSKANGTTVNNGASLFWTSDLQVAGHVVSTDADTITAADYLDNSADPNYGKLVTNVLLPKSHSVTKIGGTGYQHWVVDKKPPASQPGWAAKNYLLSSCDQAGGGICGDKLVWGAWRVEVEPAAASLDDVFLNVLIPSDGATTNAATMVTIKDTEGNISTNNMVGVLIRDAKENRVALFSADMTGAAVNGAVSYSVAYTTATSTHMLYDMPPGAKYSVAMPSGSTVSVTPDAAGSYIVNAQGVLSFQISSAVAVPPPVKPGSPKLKLLR